MSTEEEVFTSSEPADFTDEPEGDAEQYTEQEKDVLLGAGEEAIWVNNVNLLNVQDNTTQCGDGTVSYDVDTGTLTLNNATIDTHNDVHVTSVYYWSFIWLNTQKDCTIVLNGENYIGKTGDRSQGGIMAECNLTIKGSGSLTIEAGGTSWDKQFNGINAPKTNITIQDTTITMTNTAVASQGEKNNFRGITAKNGDKITISNTKLYITDYSIGIEGESIEIKDKSEVKMKIQEQNLQPSFGINGSENVTVRQSDLQCELTGTEKTFDAVLGRDTVTFDNAIVKIILGEDNDYNCISSYEGEVIIKNGSDIHIKSAYPTIWAKTGITIEDSSIKAISTKDAAVYTPGTLVIKGTADIYAKGYRCGLQSDGDMTISGGKIDAVSSNASGIFSMGRLEVNGNPDIKSDGYLSGMVSNGDMTISGGKIDTVGSKEMGVFSRGMLDITGGEIYAKGAPGYAGIAARIVRTLSEEAVPRINADAMAEKNNAKVAFSGWSDNSEGKKYSWSSFISQQDEVLDVQGGAMVNAVNEVRLAPAYTVTFDANGGSGANVSVKVYPGNTVAAPVTPPTRPGYYLSGWLAEDGSYYDFVSTPVNQNMTLKASWVPNVYYYTIQATAGEHGVISPSGSISVREYADQTFTFTPEEGYEIAEVLVDGKKVEMPETAEKVNSYKFEQVTSGHSISVSFLRIVPENYPDGTVAKPDGSFETPDGVIILPDGTIILNDKDKTELKPDSDGNAAIVNKNGTVTAQDGSVRNPDGTYVRPARPVIENVKIEKNRVNIYLNQSTGGAAGYDYVISPNPNCISDKDYTQVSKNVLLPNTSMFYVQQDTYYAYCHSWLRDNNGKKVFSQWSEGYEFTVSDYTPDTPSVVRVANPKKGVVVVTVSVPEGAKGFDVILGRSVKKVNGEKRPVNYGSDVRKNKKNTLQTVTFNNVKPGRVYAALHSYSRTSETNTKVFSRWSAYKMLKVK